MELRDHHRVSPPKTRSLEAEGRARCFPFPVAIGVLVNQGQVMVQRQRVNEHRSHHAILKLQGTSQRERVFEIPVERTYEECGLHVASST